MWLQSLQSWINFHCPTLQTFLVKGISIAWLIIFLNPEKTEQIGQAEVRLVINVDKSFELQILKKVVKQQEITEREVLLPYLHSFGPDSTYNICKGINKEQASALHQYTKLIFSFPPICTVKITLILHSWVPLSNNLCCQCMCHLTKLNTTTETRWL